MYQGSKLLGLYSVIVIMLMAFDIYCYFCVRAYTKKHEDADRIRSELAEPIQF